MLIKGLNECDFVNYKKISMFIATTKCTWKCEKDCGIKGLCQNSSLALEPNIEIPTEEIVNRYINNPITHAIVIAGLEPYDTPEDLLELIKAFREKTQDDIVIYTGYTEDELMHDEVCHNYINENYKNIIIKYGRYIPDQEPHYDEVLGVKLASDNQYARRIS